MKKIISVLLCFISLLAVMTVPVYGAENIAIGKRAFASSEFNDLYCVANINDGDYATAWSQGDVVLTGRKGGYQYIAVDLGGPHIIHQIKGVSRQDFDQIADRTGWGFQVSNDPDFETAVDVGRRIDGGEFKSSTTINLTLKEPYRYVRIYTRSYMVAAELEVYGEPVSEGGIANYIDIEDNTTDGAAKLLSYLDIMGGISIDEFGPNHLITRTEAAKLIASIIKAPISTEEKTYFKDIEKNHAYAGYINYCVLAGIISQAEFFNPDDFVKMVDFEKMLLTAMGYSRDIQAEGGYPSGVIYVGKKLGLDKGIATEYNSHINKEYAAKMMLNALMSPVLKLNSYIGDVNFYGKDETLLGQVYNMEINKGIVEENNVTSFSAPVTHDEKYIKIEGEEFFDATGDIKNHLGERVFYLTDIDNPQEIILYWVDDSKTEITVVHSRDIKECEYRTVHYLKDEEKESLELEQRVEVIKNGVAVSDWKTEDFKADDAYIKAIDNDSDGLVELIYFYLPEIYVTDYASDKGKLVIGGKNNKRMSKDFPENIFVTKAGKKKNFADISSGDVVYAYISDDGRSMSFDVSQGYAEGSIKAVDDTKGLITLADGSAYFVTDYYTENKSGMAKAEPGKDAVLYLNSENRVVWVDKAETAAVDMIGFIHSLRTEGIASVQFKIFSIDKKFGIYDTAEKVMVDGIRYTEAEFFDKASKTPEYFVEKFIQFKLNKEGKIFFMDVESPTASNLEPDSKMIKSDVKLESTFEYLSSGVNGIYDRNMMIFPMELNTPTFVIPKLDGRVARSSEFENDYNVLSAQSAFPNTMQIREETAFYGQDEMGFPTFAVLYRVHYAENSDGIAFITDRYSKGYVVDGLNLGLDEFGSASYVISGYDLMTGAKTEIVISSDVKDVIDSYSLQQKHTEWLTGDWLLNVEAIDVENLDEDDLADYKAAIHPLTDIKKGDIVRCQMEGNSASVVERVFKNTSGPIAEYTSADGSYYNSGPNPNWPFAYFRLTAGGVDMVKDNYVKIKTAAGYYEVFAPETVTTLLVFDESGLKKYAGKEFTSFFDESSKVVLFTQQQKNLCAVIYND